MNVIVWLVIFFVVFWLLTGCTPAAAAVLLGAL